MTFMEYMPSYSPMDRQAHEREVKPITEEVNIEKPIFPMSELGTTFVENDPTGRFRNVLQTAQASIRQGAGTLQLIMMTAPGQPIGGRFKAYGAEVREALKELAKASEVKIRGIEMPTAMNNLSGWDMQRNRFSEEVRQEYLNEIRDGVRFAAETMGGGGIDIVSWEFQRGINDAKWNEPAQITLPSGQKVMTRPFQQKGEVDVIQVVDTVTGTVAQARKGEILHLAKDPVHGDSFWRDEKGNKVVLRDEDGKPVVDPETGKEKYRELGLQPDGSIKLVPWTWKDFEDNAKRHIDPVTKKVKEVDPEKFYFEEQIQAQLTSYEGMARRHAREAEDVMENRQNISNVLKENKIIERNEQGLPVLNAQGQPVKRELTDAERNKYSKRLEDLKTAYAELKKSAEGQREQAEELKAKINRLVPVKQFAFDRSAASYGEAGVWAHQESTAKGLPRPVHVGPELGWPEYFGSHPKEWVGLIRSAREKMVGLLTKEYRTVKEGDKDVLVDIEGNPLKDEGGKSISADEYGKLSSELKSKAVNPYFIKDLTEQQAKEEAKRHIKGMFDTSHMGMFLQHFRPDLPWDQRVKEFNKWYMEQIDWLAKENKNDDLIGGVQIVDTQTGAHSHLPPGQGVLPLVAAMTKLKKDGKLQGFLVSEGHEEEKFGEGRILLKTWEKFGAHLGRDYFPAAGPAPLQWNRSFSSNYFGSTYSPTFIFGAYAPSNEFKLWSEIPFE